MARKSPAQLLRLRNKDLKAARAAIERLSVTPCYTLSFLKDAVAEVSKSGRVGDHVRVPLPLRLRPGAILAVEDVTMKDIHVLRDCA